jgi:hypothetical protein
VNEDENLMRLRECLSNTGMPIAIAIAQIHRRFPEDLRHV